MNIKNENTMPDIPLLERAIFVQMTMGDSALQTEVTQIFFKSTPDYIKRFKAALSAQDKTEWNQIAHGLKGAALGLGFARIAEDARQMEQSQPNAKSLEVLTKNIKQTHEKMRENKVLK